MRCLALLALLLVPLDAAAQVTALGPVSSSPPAGVSPVRWPDVAYDPSTDIALAVSGAGRVMGALRAGDGSALGDPFLVDEDAGFAQAPRVAYVPGAGFVVAWHATVGDATRVRARRWTSAGPASSSFDVSAPGTNWEMGAALAAAPDGTLLVAWQTIPARQIAAQRIDASGLMGAPIVVDARPIYFRDPAVAYDPATATFVVAYAGCVVDGDCFVEAQRIAPSGALSGVPIVLASGLRAGYVPELVHVAHTGRMLCVYYQLDGAGASMAARSFGADGVPSPAVSLGAIGAYDANGLAYAAATGTIAFVSHGAGSEDVAFELDAEGRALAGGVPFGPSGGSGNFNPRVTATRSGWLAVTSTGFASLTTIALTSGAPALDAGTPDASPPTDAGSDAPTPHDAPTLDAGAGSRPGLSVGCGCRAARGAPPTALAVLGLAFWLRRKRVDRSGRER